jgi:hypothetical protein
VYMERIKFIFVDKLIKNYLESSTVPTESVSVDSELLLLTREEKNLNLQGNIDYIIIMNVSINPSSSEGIESENVTENKVDFDRNGRRSNSASFHMVSTQTLCYCVFFFFFFLENQTETVKQATVRFFFFC